VVNNYAFHLNATSFADLLSATARQRGVINRVDHVSSVNVNPNELIASVDMQSGTSLDADLYVDCTGFRGVLIEQALHDPWVDWSDVLLCDRAVVRRGSRDETMRPYTISAAVDSGWIWQIPLVNQTGMGYVYSSSHASDEQAARTLNQYAGVDSDAEVRQLHMRVGCRENFWRGNCVAIGLAGGFIEPLESTGIFFIQRALEDLVELFPDSRFQPSLVETYNARLTATYEETRDFIILHYILSNREDSEFWLDARSVDVPQSLQRTLEFYRANGRILESPRNPVFRETNFYHILVGGGSLPQRYDARADFSSYPAVCELMAQIRSNNEQLATGLPNHSDLMRWLHT